MPVNPILLQQVKQALFSKRAFMPPAPPPGGAPPPGAPPMDPSMMGGATPPGAPPTDPSMMGGAPPMDPSMMGGAPPMDPAMMGGGAPPPPPPPAAPQHDPNQIRQLIQEEIQKSMTGGADGAKAKSKGAKVDPAHMLEYMERQQKLLVNLYQSLGLNLPYDILDKPKNPEEEAEGGQDQANASPPPTSSDLSGIPPIQPIQPIGGKQASISQKAQAMRYMLHAMNIRG